MTLLFGPAEDTRVPELGTSGAVLGAHFVLTRARGSSRTSSRSCVAFFAHVDGFILGLLVARLLGRAGQAAPREQWRSTA